MTDRLKPCPFCGKDAQLSDMQLDALCGIFRYSVGCSDPECIGFLTACNWFSTKEGALAAWNRRPSCDGCRWVYSEDRWKECRYCSRRWLYTDRYEPKDNDEQEE